MRRREFLVVVGSVAAWPAVARAQQSSKPVVGWLGLTSESGEAEMIAAFRRGLKEAGFDEGRNVSIEFRFAEGDVSRLPTLATELAGKTALLVTGTTAASVNVSKAPASKPKAPTTKKKTAGRTAKLKSSSWYDSAARSIRISSEKLCKKESDKLVG
jgi:ABC-type uncharacterized transport system substrate-binding protein